jgi:adenylate kinase
MISDAQVTETLLETLLQDQYRVGALVDGFPRTEIQVDHVSLLYDRMLTLKRQNPQLYPRPVFRSNPPQPPTVATLPPSPESRGA